MPAESVERLARQAGARGVDDDRGCRTATYRIEVRLHRLVNGVNRSVRGGVRREVGRGNAIAFDGRHTRATGGRRHGEYSNAGIQIDHRAVGRYLRDDVGREVVDQIAVSLEE